MTDERTRKLVEQGICPVCGNRLTHKEGCLECDACGWSTCQEA